MRIHAISLRDFRGVDSVDVEFDIEGVTIVEGQNEAGKSTLADAFSLLLEEKDSSRKQKVRSAQPVGRDVGPFVEAELSAGPYRMTYRKRWLADKMTELHISSPTSEQLTGGEAHKRMEEILESETDTALFDALRYHQGEEISQAAVGDSPTLTVALDAAAGGAGSRGGDGAEAVLFAKVEEERLNYVTPTGQLIGDRKMRAEQLEELREKLSETTSRLRELDDAVERFGQIEKELEDTRAEFDTVESRIKEEQAVVQELEGIERRVETARHGKENAEIALRVAQNELDTRESLVKAVDKAAHEHKKLEQEVESASPGLEAAKLAVDEAREDDGRAREELESAEKAAKEARKVVELHDLRLERDQLKERHERVVAASKTIDEADQFLAGCSVDEKLLARITKAREKVAVVQARAEADNPRLKIEALSDDLRVEAEGKKVDVKKDSPLEETIATEVSIVINDLARVTVARQQAGGDAKEHLEAARGELDALLESAGVASPEKAAEVVRERARREVDRENAEKRRLDDLRDLDPPELAAKVERAEERLEQLEPEADTGGQGESDLEGARSALKDLDAKAASAKESFAKSQATLEVAEKKLRGLEDSNIEQRTRLASAKEESERASGELEEQRKSVADGSLAETVAKATEVLTAASEALSAAEVELKDGDPASARAVLENSVKLRDGLTQRIRASEIESVAIKTKLEVGGSDGLADRYAEGRAELEELEQSIDAENRRAEAAELLFEVLSEKREKAQQAYVRPLREKLNAYSRILYGPKTEVEIDHSTLQIVTLTREGKPIPFEALSGGVREQLAVLARLACAALVSPASDDGDPGGVPVIIDDALGYSDPRRLKQLGAAINLAGEDCQVIVLTCEPGRYRGVGSAKRVSLDAAVKESGPQEGELQSTG